MNEVGVMARAAGGGRKSAAGLSVAPVTNSLKKIEPPPELTGEYARSIWSLQSAILIERQVLTSDHVPLLLAYCNSFELMIECDRRITADGLTVVSLQGAEKKHPAISARQDAIGAMVRIGSLLGLDPTSYRRMNGPSGNSDDSGNPFDEFV